MIAADPKRPSVLKVHADGIPQELTALNRWVLWRLQLRNGSEGKPATWTKVPCQLNGLPASSTNHDTWSTFDEVLQRYQQGGFDGIGFMFDPADGFLGIDLDKCRDKETGVLHPRAEELILEFATYAEISPSGTGVKLIGRGKVRGNRGTRKPSPLWPGEIEMYDHARYFALTGAALYADKTSIGECQPQCNTLYALINTKKERQSIEKRAAGPPADDGVIIAKARAAKNGVKFDQLWAGDWKAAGYPSQSEADLALCSMLAFYTGPNPPRIDGLFRQSGLVRDKWTDRDDYRQETIKKALEDRSEFFNWRSNGATRKCPVAGSDLPTIDITVDDLPSHTTAAWDAVEKANHPPHLFRSSGLPSRIERDDFGHVIVVTLDQDRMRHELARKAKWVRRRKNHGQEMVVKPPPDVVRDVLATPDNSLPILIGVAEAPKFAQDGTLHDRPGYHPATKIYYEPEPGFIVPTVPEFPTNAEIEQARRLITVELLGDFPFTSQSELAHAVAMLLQPFARELIAGPTPLYLIEKPTAGTGATLLAECLTRPASGLELTTMTEGRDEDEWRKRITSMLRSCSQFLFIDNLNRRLDSPALASVLTTLAWKDRILGTSQTIHIPVRCTFAASGNNPTVSAEISRRTIRIRLDAKVDQPWLRKDFRHPNLRQWAKKNRGQLCWAALTLIRAWLSAGRPTGKGTMGQYEDWVRVIGGVLEVASVPGFLSNIEQFYEDADSEGAAWRTFVTAWWDAHQERAAKVADLVKLTHDEINGIELSLGDGVGEHSQRARLGKMLSRARDRIFEIPAIILKSESESSEGEGPCEEKIMVQIIRDPISQHSYSWRLKKLPTAGTAIEKIYTLENRHNS